MHCCVALRCVGLATHATHAARARSRCTGDDKKVNVWRVGSPSSAWSLAGNSAAVECVCFDEEETTVASGSRGGAVKVCVARTPEELYFSLPLHGRLSLKGSA